MRQIVAHKLSADILSVSRALAVPLDTDARRWQRRCALAESGVVSDLSGVTTGVRERPADKIQKAHGVLRKKDDSFDNWVGTRPLDCSGRLNSPKFSNCHRL